MARTARLLLTLVIALIWLGCGSSSKKIDNTNDEAAVLAELNTETPGVDLTTQELTALNTDLHAVPEVVPLNADPFDTDTRITGSEDPVFETVVETTFDADETSTEAVNPGGEQDTTVAVKAGCLLTVDAKSASVGVIERVDDSTMKFTAKAASSITWRVRCVRETSYPDTDETLKLTLTLKGKKIVYGEEAILGHAVDASGGYVVGVAGSPTLKSCARGRFRGIWKMITTKDHGTIGWIAARWQRRDGVTDGLLRGVLGKNDKGENVFRIKYLDTTGKIKGTLAGTFTVGEKHHVLVGKWKNMNNENQGWVRAVLWRGAKTGLLRGQWIRTGCMSEENQIDELVATCTAGDTADVSDTFTDDREDAVVTESVLVNDVDTIMTKDAVVKTQMEADRAFIAVHLFWGHGRYQQFAAREDWGTQQEPLKISLNSGVFLVSRLIRFEKSDSMLARTDGKSAEFISWTSVHHDGVSLKWAPELNGPAPVITFTSKLLTQAITVPDFLTDPHQTFVKVYDVPNSTKKLFVIMYMRLKKPTCNNHLLLGSWARVVDGKGSFLGFFASLDGNKGFARGVYGAGKFCGKIVATNTGALLWTMAGTYEKNTSDEDRGSFTGDYKDRDGNVKGTVNGVYWRSDRLRRRNGFFLGRAMSNDCKVN